MNINQYLIISKVGNIKFYYAIDIKQAICKYAAEIPFKIRDELFKKVILLLNTNELIELFNQECWDMGDEIKHILTGCETLYSDIEKE